MAESTLNYVAALVKSGLWCYLFVQGFRLDLIRRFGFVFTYIGVAAFCDLFMLGSAAWLGTRSPVYMWIYLVGEMAILLAAIAALLWIYFLPAEKATSADWPLLALIPLVLALEFFSSNQSWIGFRVLATAQTLTCFIALAALLRTGFDGSFVLGRNLRCVVLALLFPVCLETVNNLAYLLNSEVWTYTLRVWATKPVVIGSWLLMAWGMSRKELPRRIEVDASPQERAEAAELLKDYLRLLRRLGKRRS